MGLHTATIELLEDARLCQTVLHALNRNYSRRYIQHHYGITRRMLDRLIQTYAISTNKNVGFVTDAIVDEKTNKRAIMQ